jgi:nucleotide-binding universal stress UspA family protein
MYRKILVPLDGSNLSESIIDQAKTLVLDCGIPEMVLLTVVEPFREQPYRYEDNWKDKIQKEAVRVAANYLKELKDRLNIMGHRVDTVVIEGDPAQAILDYSKKNGVDLIIMNARGRTAGNRWTFGSVTNKIIGHSPVPVLVAPSKFLSQMNKGRIE